MKDNCAIYLVSRIYPNTNGGTQHNIGTCNYLMKYFHMTMVSLIDHRYEIEEAENDLKDCNFELVLCHSEAVKGYKERFCMLEPVDGKTMDKIVQLVDEKSTSVVFFTLKMLPYVQQLRKRCTGLQFIYISHNAEFMNITDDIIQYDRMNHVNRIRHMIKLGQAKAFIGKEREAICKSDFVFSISNNDTEVLSQKYHVSRNKFILNKPMIRYDDRKNCEKWKKENYTNKLLIVGNMSWYPTVKGTKYFVEHIYTKLKAVDETLKLFIVGARPSQELIDCAQNDSSIVITGFVESVKEYYEQCDIAVVPIYEGTGAKLKVLEAIGNDIPVVMTSYVAKDYEGVQQAAMIADNDNELVQNIQKLMNSESLRKQMCDQEEKYYSQYMKENIHVDRFFEGCKENNTTK